jgi:hypothetical protein
MYKIFNRNAVKGHQHFSVNLCNCIWLTFTQTLDLFMFKWTMLYKTEYKPSDAGV